MFVVQDIYMTDYNDEMTLRWRKVHDTKNEPTDLNNG